MVRFARDNIFTNVISNQLGINEVFINFNKDSIILDFEKYEYAQTFDDKIPELIGQKQLTINPDKSLWANIKPYDKYGELAQCPEKTNSYRIAITSEEFYKICKKFNINPKTSIKKFNTDMLLPEEQYAKLHNTDNLEVASVENQNVRTANIVTTTELDSTSIRPITTVTSIVEIKYAEKPPLDQQRARGQ